MSYWKVASDEITDRMLQAMPVQEPEQRSTWRPQMPERAIQDSLYYHRCPMCGGYLQQRGDFYTCQGCPWEYPSNGEKVYQSRVALAPPVQPPAMIAPAPQVAPNTQNTLPGGQKVTLPQTQQGQKYEPVPLNTPSFITFNGGTVFEQRQVIEALDASSFNFAVVGQITVNIVTPGTPYADDASPGSIQLAAVDLDKGVWSWGMILHELGHQVDFALLNDQDRSNFLLAFKMSQWWTGNESDTGHKYNGGEIFADMVSCAYWTTQANWVCPGMNQDELHKMMPMATFQQMLNGMISGDTKSPSVQGFPALAPAGSSEWGNWADTTHFTGIPIKQTSWHQAKTAMALGPHWDQFLHAHPILWHATHEYALTDIMTKGIQPDMPGHNEGYFEARPGHVYLWTTYESLEQGGPSASNAEFYLPGSPSILLEIDTKQLDPNLFAADEDFFENNITYNNGLGVHSEDDWAREEANPGELNLGQWAQQNAEIVDHPDNTWDSSEYQGSIAYAGTVPPSAILKVIDTNDERTASWKFADGDNWFNPQSDNYNQGVDIPGNAPGMNPEGDMPADEPDEPEIGTRTLENNWVYLEGKVKFGHHWWEIVGEMVRDAGFDETTQAYIANTIARNALPQDLDIAVGSVRGDKIQIWASTVDRNSVWDAVSDAKK